MKKAKFIAELCITAICLVMIYSFAIQSKDNGGMAATSATMQMAAQQLAVSHATTMDEAGADDSAYGFVGSTKNLVSLQEQAKAEAERMIETGDTSRFEAEIHKNSAALNAMGY